jgi:hypothetical protein
MKLVSETGMRRDSTAALALYMALAGAAIVATGMLGTAQAQTFQPTPAIRIHECQVFLGVTTGCNTIETNRLTQQFTLTKLSSSLFGETWATATHCTYLVSTSAMCQNAVQAWSDPLWGRIVWTYANSFIKSYGKYGGAKDAAGNSIVGTFNQPRGMSMTQREGNWHAVFVADAGNNRVVALALNFATQAVTWLGVVDGHESGVLMNQPWDVAWDPAGTWKFSDDRLFIADKGNHRILVYHVALDFTTNPNVPTMTTSYFNAFGTQGSGLSQFSYPEGVAVRTSLFGQFGDIYITDMGNKRVARWSYDGSPLAAQPAFARAVSPTLPGTQLSGISLDNYEDVIVSDRQNGFLHTFNRTSLIPLKVFGGNGSWANGAFNQPTKPEVVYAHRLNPDSSRLDIGLPYVSTSEQWTDTTGGELHRLGVDVDSLSVIVPNTPGARTATVSFLFTATGSYSESIKNSAGTVVKTLRANAATFSGWQTQGWDGKDNSGVVVPYGNYSAFISYQSGYSYDSVTPRTISKSFAFVAPPTLTVTIQGPTSVVKGVAKTWTSTVSNGTSPYTYKWTRNGATVGTSASYTGSATVCGTFTIILTVTDSNSNTATRSIDVDVTGGTPPCAV